MCQPPPASPALTAAAAEGSATCRISVARISTKSAMSARLPCCAIRAAEMCESGMPSSADSSRSCGGQGRGQRGGVGGGLRGERRLRPGTRDR
eukprot:27543-Chlamydomonas_euryale.AAC.14